MAAFRRHCALEGERLLDIGCGNGAYTIALAEGFQEAHGIDIESGRLEIFRDGMGNAANLFAHEMAAEELSFPAGHFDVVTAIEVLEHIVDLDKALGEVWRVLRPGGAFLISIPNRLFPLETHYVNVAGRQIDGRYLPFLPYLPPLHHRIALARNFSARELDRLLTKRGFRRSEIDYVMPPFDHSRLGRRALKPLLDQLERTPLRIFGVSLIAVYLKV